MNDYNSYMIQGTGQGFSGQAPGNLPLVSQMQLPMQQPVQMPPVPLIWANEPDRYYEMQRRLNEKGEEAFLEVEKKRRIKANDVEESIRYAEIRADINSQRELQKTEVIISKEGQIEILKQQFGSDKREKFPFVLSKFFLLRCIGLKQKAILQVVFLNGGGQKVDLYFNMRDMGDREINKKFNEGGIRFGFSYKKETQMRRLLLMKLISMAKEIEIPLSHGWYRDGKGGLHFAFPKDQVWKEVQEYV